MKIFLAVVLIASILLLVTNCMIYYWPTDWTYRMSYRVGVSSELDALRWVANEIHYKSDDPLNKDDAWQLPHETYEKRTGDCEDQAALLLYLIYIELEIETVRFILTENHALVRIGDVYYDPTAYYIGPKYEGWEVLFELNFGEIMYHAANY